MICSTENRFLGICFSPSRKAPDAKIPNSPSGTNQRGRPGTGAFDFIHTLTGIETDDPETDPGLSRYGLGQLDHRYESVTCSNSELANSDALLANKLGEMQAVVYSESPDKTLHQNFRGTSVLT